ncbi:MAG: efflux RND transporter permease subunit [Bacteroidota bacterium]
MADNKKIITPIPTEERISIIDRSSRQVSRGVFFSTVIIIASFLPVFLLTGQEGKLFHPLAWTKTFILIVDAVLVITLAPVLMSIFLKGTFRGEQDHPVNRFLEQLYEPVIRMVLRNRKTTLAVNIAAMVVCVPLLMNMGREFMPPLDEQSILFMPVTLPDVSNSEIKRILQVQDRIIRSVPEVKLVLGKAGRASTATDNSPISMIETIILLKPREEWRPGITKKDIISELDRKLRIPGVINGWTQPIINRINMLATGIRTDAGIKVFGQHLDTIQAVAGDIRKALETVPGVHDLYVDPLTGGNYLTIDIDREAAGKYGLSIDDINMIVESAIGGMAFTKTVEGRRRIPVSLRLAGNARNDLAAIRKIPIRTAAAGTIPLSAVATVKLEEGPSMIASENAMLRGAVLFNVRNRDLSATVEEAMAAIGNGGVRLPKGYYLEWSGQYEHLIRSQETLLLIIPVVLLVIFISLYLAFRSVREAMLSLITIPFALTGGVFMVWFYGVNLSVAVAVGFIALFGIAVETGVVMVIYLNDAMLNLVKRREAEGLPVTREDLHDAVMNGAAKRLRPKIMTVSVALFGLIPVLWSTGAGSDVMIPIVLPMIGGVITSSTHILLVTPLIFLMTKEYELRKYGKPEVHETH